MNVDSKIKISKEHFYFTSSAHLQKGQGHNEDLDFNCALKYVILIGDLSKMSINQSIIIIKVEILNYI